MFGGWAAWFPFADMSDFVSLTSLPQGCASWNWYYPFHYAPFASDFEGIADMPSDFEKGSKPVGLLIYPFIHCWFALSFQVSHTCFSAFNSSSLLNSLWGCSQLPVETSCRQRGGNSWQTRWESLLYSWLEAQVMLQWCEWDLLLLTSGREMMQTSKEKFWLTAIVLQNP